MAINHKVVVYADCSGGRQLPYAEMTLEKQTTTIS